MLNTIVSTSPGSLDSMIAWRSEPNPLSFVFVTAISRPTATTEVDADAALSDGSVSAPSLVTPVVNTSVAPPSVLSRNSNVAVLFAASVGSVHVNVLLEAVVSAPPADDVVPSTSTFGSSGSSESWGESTPLNRTPVASLDVGLVSVTV